MGLRHTAKSRALGRMAWWMLGIGVVLGGLGLNSANRNEPFSTDMAPVVIVLALILLVGGVGAKIASTATAKDDD